jgi:uncharacterized membrane protein
MNHELFNLLIMKNKPDSQMLDQMSKNPAYWKGIFYVNKRDPCLIVPKQQPMLGWTVNFASPYAYVIIVLIVAIILASKFYF